MPKALGCLLYLKGIETPYFHFVAYQFWIRYRIEAERKSKKIIWKGEEHARIKYRGYHVKAY